MGEKWWMSEMSTQTRYPSMKRQVNGQKRPIDAAAKDWTPLVSFVIPMYNESQNITGCLDAILTQDYPQDKIEILVVDGMSSDGSREKVLAYVNNHQNIRLLDNPDRLTPKGLNIGVKHARGEVIIILGAHTKIKRDFVRLNIHYMQEKGVPCVGGTQINIGKTYIQQAIGHVMGSPFGITSAPYRYRRRECFVDTVVYAAYKRELFDEVGYFDEDCMVSEDAEFNWRVRKAGHRIFYSPRIVTYYVPRENLPKLIKQFFRYGILRVNVFKKHVDAIRFLHLVPSIFIVAALGTGFGALFSKTALWAFLSLISLYGFFVIIASISTSFRHGWRFLPVFPFIFMALHFSWGLGFLAGLFKSHR